MASFVDLIREIFTLTDNVNRFETILNQLGKRVDEHEVRIHDLENREELLQEKMANTAIKAVNEMNHKLFERLHEVENTIKSLPQFPRPQS